MTNDHARSRAGLFLGLGAYFLWGFLPLYFKLLANLLPTEIVAHRILWSLVFLAVLATVWKRWGTIREALRAPRVMAMLLATSVLIAGNWLVYIWAVLNGHVLEGSLGYYLNPLVNVLLGVVLLKEKLSRAQIFAVGLASAGVAVLAVGAGSGLWISLTLACTFAAYGFIRKVAPVDSLEGLSIETALLAPVALAWLFWLEHEGSGAMPMDLATTLLVMGAGLVTAVPLLLFAAAAKRLPYSTLGFLQYVAPTIQFLLAVSLFGEKLTTAHIICFGAIWSALVIFAVDGIRSGRRASRARRAESDKAAACVEPCSVP